MRRGWQWNAAGDRVRGAVAASDAFFPFPDGLETLNERRCEGDRASRRVDARRRGGRGGDQGRCNALRHRSAPLRPLIGCGP